MASTEIIDIVDKENNVVGTTDVNTAHNEKLMHRVAGVFVFSPDGHLYLQTGNKYGKLDLSVGGHVQKGESYEQAAQRETHEEIGLEVALTHVSTFLPKEARLNTETEEVKSLEKISLDEIKQMMKSEPDLFTHGFMNTMQELIRIKNI
jgi:isopentenyldiphosphate isomerase